MRLNRMDGAIFSDNMEKLIALNGNSKGGVRNNVYKECQSRWRSMKDFVSADPAYKGYDPVTSTLVEHRKNIALAVENILEHPNSAEAYIKLGELSARQGNVLDVSDPFSQTNCLIAALECEPNSETIHKKLGSTLLNAAREGSGEARVAFYNTKLETVIEYMNRADVSARLDFIDKEITVLEKMKSLNEPLDIMDMDDLCGRPRDLVYRVLIPYLELNNYMTGVPREGYVRSVKYNITEGGINRISQAVEERGVLKNLLEGKGFGRNNPVVHAFIESQRQNDFNDVKRE